MASSLPTAGRRAANPNFSVGSRAIPEFNAAKFEARMNHNAMRAPSQCNRIPIGADPVRQSTPFSASYFQRQQRPNMNSSFNRSFRQAPQLTPMRTLPQQQQRPFSTDVPDSFDGFAPQSSWRREPTALREIVSQVTAKPPGSYGSVNSSRVPFLNHAPTAPITNYHASTPMPPPTWQPQPSCSSSSSRPVSALQAAYERQSQAMVKNYLPSVTPPPPPPATTSAAAPPPPPPAVITDSSNAIQSAVAKTQSAPVLPTTSPAPLTTTPVDPCTTPKQSPECDKLITTTTEEQKTVAIKEATPAPLQKPTYCGPSATHCRPTRNFDTEEYLRQNGCCGYCKDFDCGIDKTTKTMTIDANLLKAPASFTVPDSVYGEVCIKTPCQVEIVERRPAECGQVRRRSLASCAVHGKGDQHPRYNYTQYAQVHDLNCSGVSMISQGGVPNLCGRCVPPRPQPPAAASGNLLQVPSPFQVQAGAQRERTPTQQAQSHNNNKNCNCASGPPRKMRTYEDIKRECEMWAAERQQREREKQTEVVGKENDSPVDEEKVCATAIETGEGKKDKSNFMQLIKEITAAIQNVGAGGGSGAKETQTKEPPIPPIPEIIVTPPTPPRAQTPLEGTNEVRHAATQERELVTALEKLVADEAVQKEQEPQVAQMFAWGRTQGKQQQQEQEQKAPPSERQITPSECGFCKGLAAVRLESAFGKRE